MADGTNVDKLQIEIDVSAENANSAIDNLVKKLDRLQTSLGKINGSQLAGVANGVDKLGKSMQTMNTIKTADFTRLSTNLAKLGDLNVSGLNSSASSLSHLSRALNTLNGANFDNKNLQNLINSITRLSNANVGNLSNVDFSKIGNSINQLATSLSNAPKIQQSIISMTNAVSNLSKFAQNIPIASSSLGDLGKSLNAFMSSVSSAPSVSENVIYFAQAIGTLSNAGTKAGVTAQNLSALGVGLVDLMTTLSKAPNVNKNIIDMTNALANLATQGAKVGSASKSIEKGLNRANNSATRASKSFGGLASAIGKFYASYFMVIRGIKGLYKSIEGTADYLEAFNYFNVALGKIGSDWSHQFEQYGYESAEAYADSFSTRLQSSLKNLSGLQISVGADGNGLLTETGLKNLGLNIQEITQYTSQLASVTNSVGQVGEVSLAAANSLTKLGADLSSLFNLDYSSVMQNLQSGLIGQSRALYKYGIDITNATLQTKAYELGLSKSVSEMTQAEKMQLRMLVILQDSKVAWGDLANTINSPSNMIRQFKNNLKEVGMVLGQLFIPLMQKVMPVINGVTIALKRLLVSIAGFLGIQLDLSSFGQGYSGLGEDVEGLTDSLDDATASAKKLKSVTLGIDELNINAPQEDTGKTTSGVGGGIDLTDEILEATSEYEKVWEDAFNNMENKAQEFANKIEKIFEPIVAPIKNLIYHAFRGEWDIAGKDVSNLAIGIFDLFTKAIDKVNWKNIGKEIGEFFKGLEWKEIISSAGNFLETALESAGELLEGAFDANPIATTIVTALGLAKFSGLDKTIANKIISACPTNVSIGKTILISGITWEIGFDFGKKIAEIFSETDAGFEDFTFFGEDGFFKNAFSDLESSFDALGEMYKQPLLASLISLLIGPMGTALGSLSSFLNNETVIMFGDWLENSVAPWFTVEKWMELGSSIPMAIGQKWNELVAWWNVSGVKKWIVEKVAPWLTKEKWLELASGIKIAILEKWNEFTNWWTNNGVSKWFEEKVKPWFTKETWETNISGIKTAFSNTFKNVANGVIGWLNKIISAIESLVNNAISGLDGISDIINEIPGVEIEVSAPTISLPRIPTYSLGGYDIPEDGWFRASKGEYFGRFDDGTSYIANNNQIEAGISVGVGQAVREAVSEILAPYLADIAQNTRETADKDLSVNIGDRDIARANARGQRSLGYALIT